MEEPYAEDVASHSGPESWGSGREAGVQALTGVHVGRVLSRVIRSRVPTAFPGLRKAIRAGAIDASAVSDPPRSKTPSMHGTSTRENREILGCPVAEDGAAGGPGKA